MYISKYLVNTTFSSTIGFKKAIKHFLNPIKNRSEAHPNAILFGYFSLTPKKDLTLLKWQEVAKGKIFQ